MTILSNAPVWRTRCALGFMTGVGALLIANAALAEETCDADHACPHGFVCTMYEVASCAEPACARDDEQCAKAQPECESKPFSECMPAECSEDADCAKDMVCYKHEYTTCSGGGSAPACPRDAECEPAKEQPATCETKSYASCVPRYVPPCGEDSDCGPGFLCKERKAVSCSGSTGRAGVGGQGGDAAEPAPADAAPADAGPADAAPADAGPADAGTPESEPTCTSEPSGVFYCELQKVTCDEASECPDGFSCEAIDERPVCDSTSTAPDAGSTPSGEPSAGDARDAGAADGQAPRETLPCEEPAPAAKSCLPPYAKSGFSGGVAQESRDALGSSDDGTAPGADKGQAPSEHDSAELADPASKACSISAVGAGRGVHLGMLALLPLAAVALRRRRSARPRLQA